jgi:hypothetical protein
MGWGRDARRRCVGISLGRLQMQRPRHQACTVCAYDLPESYGACKRIAGKNETIVADSPFLFKSVQDYYAWLSMIVPHARLGRPCQIGVDPGAGERKSQRSLPLKERRRNRPGMRVQYCGSPGLVCAR